MKSPRTPSKGGAPLTETGRCPVVHFDHNSDGALRRPGRVLPSAPRGVPRSRTPRRTAATGSCPATSRLRGGPRRRHASRRSATATAARACRWSSRRPPAPFHIPIEIDPPELPQVAQDRQPDHRAGGGRAHGADRQALRHLVHRRHHRGRRGRHDLGHRRPGDRDRRLARAAARALEAYASPSTPSSSRCPAPRSIDQAVKVDLPHLEERHPRGHRRAPGASRPTTSSATSSSRRSTTGR